MIPSVHIGAAQARRSGSASDGGRQEPGGAEAAPVRQPSVKASVET